LQRKGRFLALEAMRGNDQKGILGVVLIWFHSFHFNVVGFVIFVVKDFEEKAGPTYHCIVGSHFGSFVSHESKCIAYFSIGQMIVLLWKHG
jgi:hypothetical protein